MKIKSKRAADSGPVGIGERWELVGALQEPRPCVPAPPSCLRRFAFLFAVIGGLTSSPPCRLLRSPPMTSPADKIAQLFSCCQPLKASLKVKVHSFTSLKRSFPFKFNLFLALGGRSEDTFKQDWHLQAACKFFSPHQFLHFLFRYAQVA